VPFDATFATNTITIVPSTALANNQTYYVALLPNVVEDASNNTITTLVIIILQLLHQNTIYCW
jgi:hypothetical protein